MFVVKVKPEIIQHCQSQLEHYNFGQRSVANGNHEQQLTGIIGQCVVMEMFGQGYIDGSTGCDNGTDIDVMGYSVDVKTMGRTTDVRMNYVNNFIALQLKFSTQLFIFCSYHKIKKELTVCGWIPKVEFLEKASFFPKGSIRTRFDGSTFQTFADLYEIRNDLLNDVNSPESLKAQINNWCIAQNREKSKTIRPNKTSLETPNPSSEAPTKKIHQLNRENQLITEWVRYHSNRTQEDNLFKDLHSYNIAPKPSIQESRRQNDSKKDIWKIIFNGFQGSCFLVPVSFVIGGVIGGTPGIIIGIIIGLIIGFWLPNREK